MEYSLHKFYRAMLLSVLFCFVSFNSTGQNYEWAKSIGSMFPDESFSITIDASGNIYLTGNFGGTVDFDPGPDTASLTSVAGSDIFIAKYDASGNYLWAKSMGGSFGDNASSISLDDLGNVYLTGRFRDTADFDPDTNTANLTGAGLLDIFIAKYDSLGNYLWARNMGGDSSDVGKSLSIDTLYNVYVTGNFRYVADFDPGPDTANLISAGGEDIFIAKYDSSGNYLWAKNMGGTSDDYGYNLFLDASGNVCITGKFSDTAYFDPDDSTVTLISAGGEDIFLAKYNTSGNYLWAIKMGGDDFDVGNGLFIDPLFNIYVTGYFQDTVDFDPGADTANLISAGASDVFIAKYDSSGNYLWAINMGGDDNDAGNGLFIDPLFNVYVTGFFRDTADFDPGLDTANLISAGASDVFIAKYDSSGNYLWAKNMGGGNVEIGNSLSIDPLYNVYVTGNFRNTADFDPGADTANLISNGDFDIFIAKYSQCVFPIIVQLTDSICQGDSIQLPGGLWVTSAGIYYDTLTSVANCDSSITIILTIIPLPTAGITGTTAICYGDSTVLTATGGISFLWSTGDTSASISVNTLTDTAYYVFVSNPGCNSPDSDTVTITVNPLPEIIASANPISILLGEKTTLSVSGGDSYNWTPDDDIINPSSSSPIATPEKTTLYYVYGTDSNGCTNVGSVLIIVSVDFKIEVPNVFSPNGDGYNDILYVSGKGIQWIVFRIFDRWGEKVFESNDINIGWNGVYNAMPMNPAAFAYYLEAGYTNGQTIIPRKGGIALVR